MKNNLLYVLGLLLCFQSLILSVNGCFTNPPQKRAGAPQCFGEFCGFWGSCWGTCSCIGRNPWCSGYCIG
uniref:Putative secreted protein n=1 Tax=Amblyomma triste TaxID=251400 RepID=A0A023GBP5_AMBTT